MKRWNRQARLGIIAVASFVLLITVLPQVASGFGLGALANRLESAITCSSSGTSGSAGPEIPSSGSSGSGSSGSSGSGSSSTCPTSPGTLSGTVTVTGAPKGFAPALEGVGACPAPAASTGLCADPIYALTTDSAGAYSLSLPAGSWQVDGFYEVDVLGGPFLGTSVTLTIQSGATTTHNFTVPYAKPATVKGRIKVTHVPAHVTIESFSALLCPSYAPYDGTTVPIACVSAYGSPTTSGVTAAPYKVSGLPPGSWTAYPGYCTEFGCETNADAGTAVTLAAGTTTIANLTTPFVIPGNGLLDVTVTVTHAPKAFADTVGLLACPKGGGSCQTLYDFPGPTASLLLADGKWEISAFYLASPFDNAVIGHTTAVTITGGATTTAAVSVRYKTPGTAMGTIDVTGVPAHVSVTSYTVLACPASSPWTGGTPGIGCASEYSGPGGFGFGAADRNVSASPAVATHPPAGFQGFALAPDNRYLVTSLTPGTWILYPGYESLLGSYVDPTGTSVTIAARSSVTQDLDVPYQPSVDGAVYGNVDVVGAPATGFESGAQACSAKPTATTCPDQQDAYNETSGAYQLPLAPGTWWVSGFLDDYGSGPTGYETFTKPRKVIVTAGSETKENFTVTAS